MSRLVQVGAGYRSVTLPNGGAYKAGDQVVLTDSQFSSIPQSRIGTVVLDLGPGPGDGDGDVTDAELAAALTGYPLLSGGKIPDSTLPSTAVRKGEVAFRVEDEGADPTGVANSWAAFQAAKTKADATLGGYVQAGKGTFLLTPTTGVLGFDVADFGRLAGSSLGTVLKAGADNMTVLRYGSGSIIENVRVKGNYRPGVWGVASRNLVNNPRLRDVRVEECVQGLVFDAVQNCAVLQVQAYNNWINYGFYNGTQAIELFSCSGSVAAAADAGGRNIYVGNSTADDARMPGPIHYNGNGNIKFYGGIYEAVNGGTSLVEHSVEVAAIASTMTLAVGFYGTAIHGGRLSQIKVGALLAQHVVRMQDVTIAQDQNAVGVPVVIASGGKLVIDGGAWPSGYPPESHLQLSGVATYARTIDSQTTRPNVLGEANSHFQGGIGAWTAQGGATAPAWDATKRRMVVVGTLAAHGAKLAWPTIKAGYVSQYRLLRVRGALLNLTGASFVTIYTIQSASPFTRKVADVYAGGEFDFLYEMTGDEVGLSFQLGEAVVTTFEVAYVTAQII